MQCTTECYNYAYIHAQSNFSSVNINEADSTSYMPSSTAISDLQHSRTTLSGDEKYLTRDQFNEVDDSHVQAMAYKGDMRDSLKLSKPSMTDTKCCCYCHYKTRKRIKRSVSDGLLHSGMLQTVHLQPLTGRFIQDDLTTNKKFNSVKKSMNGRNAEPQQEGSKEINREDIIGSTMCRANSVHSDIDCLKSGGLLHSVDSITSNISEDIIILLSTSLDHLAEDGTGEKCTVRISESTSQQMIERQVGYLNLPTNGVDVHTQTELPYTSTGFDSPGRTRLITGESDEFAAQIRHVSSKECRQITSCSAFNAEDFVSELTFKLRQLAKSISDKPSNDELSNYDTVNPYITLLNSLSKELNSGTPVSVQRNESHHCDENPSTPPLPDSTAPLHTVSLQGSPCSGSSRSVNHQGSPINPITTTASTATGLNAHLSQVFLSESGIFPPQQNVAKCTAITNNPTTTTNTQHGICSPPTQCHGTKTDTSSNTNTAGTSFSMVNRDSFVCGRCLRCLSTQEAREKLSQMLNLACMPSSQDITCEDEDKDNKWTLTCVIATLEQTTA